MKYKILDDYGSYAKWHDDKEYEDIDEAVKEALASRYGVPFLIVNVIDWKAAPTLN